MSELELLAALALYAKHNKALPSHCSTEDAENVNQEKFNASIWPALQMIRFAAVSTRDFLHFPEIKLLLTPQQILGIVCEQIDRNISTFSLPEGFSIETVSRGMSENRPVRSIRSNLSSYSGHSGRTDMISEFSQPTSDIANGINPNTDQIANSTGVNIGSSPKLSDRMSIASNLTVNSMNEWEREIEAYRNVVENQNLKDLAEDMAQSVLNVNEIENEAPKSTEPEKQPMRREKLQFGDLGTQNHDDSLLSDVAKSSTPHRHSTDEVMSIPQAEHQSLNENIEKVNGSGAVGKDITNIKNVPQKRSNFNGGRKPKRRASLEKYEREHFVDK